MKELFNTSPNETIKEVRECHLLENTQTLKSYLLVITEYRVIYLDIPRKDN
jgi:hypothetical protein